MCSKLKENKLIFSSRSRYRRAFCVPYKFWDKQTNKQTKTKTKKSESEVNFCWVGMNTNFDISTLSWCWARPTGTSRYQFQQSKCYGEDSKKLDHYTRENNLLSYLYNGLAIGLYHKFWLKLGSGRPDQRRQPHWRLCYPKHTISGWK